MGLGGDVRTGWIARVGLGLPAGDRGLTAGWASGPAGVDPPSRFARSSRMPSTPPIAAAFCAPFCAAEEAHQ